MQSPHRVTEVSDHQQDETTRALRQSVHVEIFAECLYETAALCDRIVFEPEELAGWANLTPSQKARYRFEAIAALHRLSPSKCYEAELRAREQVADAHYGCAFHLLTGRQQREIVFRNRTVIGTVSAVLQGIFEPLPARIALSLEPSSEPTTPAYDAYLANPNSDPRD